MKKYLLLFIAFSAVFMMNACGDDKVKKTDDTSISTVQTETFVSDEHDDVEDEGIPYDTPYCRLRFPITYKDNVYVLVTNEHPYNLTFYATGDNTELYTLRFDDTNGSYIGMLHSDSGNVSISVSVPELDASIEKNIEYISYQEDLNVLINNLDKDYSVLGSVNSDNEDTTTFDIETSLVTLKYPDKWKDFAQIEVLDSKVKFSLNGTPVFDLCFGESEGSLLGTYKGTPIYIIDYETTTIEQIMMQEDVNVIIQNLLSDVDFVIYQGN